MSGRRRKKAPSKAAPKPSAAAPRFVPLVTSASDAVSSDDEPRAAANRLSAPPASPAGASSQRSSSDALVPPPRLPSPTAPVPLVDATAAERLFDYEPPVLDFVTDEKARRQDDEQDDDDDDEDEDEEEEEEEEEEAAVERDANAADDEQGDEQRLVLLEEPPAPRRRAPSSANAPPRPLATAADDATLSVLAAAQMAALDARHDATRRALTPALSAAARRVDAAARALLRTLDDELRAAVAASGIDDAATAALVASETSRARDALASIVGQTRLAADDTGDDDDGASSSSSAVVSRMLGALDARRHRSQQHIAAERRIVRAQACVRRWLARSAHGDTLRRARLRRRAVAELVAREQSYVDGLRTLVEAYAKPLRDAGDAIVSRDVQAVMFGNAEQLYAMHCELLAQLSARVGGAALDAFDNQTTCIGDIFVRLAPFFKTYTTYVNNYDAALSALVDARQHTPRFRQFIERVAAEPDMRGLDLVSFLITPVQRIMRYALQLAEIERHTPPAHADAAALRQATTAMEAVAASINESKRVAEQRTRLLSVASALGDEGARVIAAHRVFIDEWTAWLRDVRDGRLKEVAVLLFNDILLVCRRKSSLAPFPRLFSADSVGLFEHWLRLKKLIRLTRCDVRLARSDDDGALDVVVRFGERSGDSGDGGGGDATTESTYAKTFVLKIDDEAAARALVERVGRAVDEAMAAERSFGARRDAEAAPVAEYDADDALLAAPGGGGGGGGLLSPRRSSSPPPPSRVADVVALFDDVIALEHSLFQLPIDIALLLPKALASFNERSHFAYLHHRLELLKERLAAIDVRRVRVGALLAADAAANAVHLHRVIREGRDALVPMVAAVETARVTDAERARIAGALRWYKQLLEAHASLLESSP